MRAHSIFFLLGFIILGIDFVSYLLSGSDVCLICMLVSLYPFGLGISWYAKGW